jgi:hypothetical protein
MKKELLIKKAKEFMKSFDEGNVKKILAFYHDDCVIHDVGIALAFNKKSIVIRGKNNYKSFLLKVSPKKGAQKIKTTIKNFLVNNNTVCIEFVKHNMRWCEVLEFKRGKIVSNTAYWSGLPPKQVLDKLRKIL